MRLKDLIWNLVPIAVCFILLVGTVYFGSLINVRKMAAARLEPRITGGSGYLKGIQVLDREGRRLCDSPFYSDERKIITCE